MKNLLVVFLLLTATSVLAESGVEFEYGSEVYTQAPYIKGPKATNEHLAITPSTHILDYQLGIDYEINRDTTKNALLQSMLELQLSRDLFTIDRFTTNLQVGTGRIINEKGSDYSHYQFTVEEDVKITKKLTLTSSYRYRNAYNNKYYFESNTGKVGFAYELTEKAEFGLRYIRKFGAQQHSHGFEGGFASVF